MYSKWKELSRAFLKFRVDVVSFSINSDLLNVFLSVLLCLSFCLYFQYTEYCFYDVYKSLEKMNCLLMRAY